jgi:hypothetical protein
MQEKLRDVLEKGVSPEVIRIQMSNEVDQGKRDWKIERQPGERKLTIIHWSITIADVYQHKNDPVSYCDWVERWARATFKEIKVWIA